MKRVLVIFKDLQDSGQDATIIGHFTLQLGSFQDITNIDNVRESSKNALSETGSGKNPNRYITEHDRDDVGVCYPTSASVELRSDLLEVIDVWQNLPDSIRAGIVAMVKATSSASEQGESNRELFQKTSDAIRGNTKSQKTSNNR